MCGLRCVLSLAALFLLAGSLAACDSTGHGETMEQYVSDTTTTARVQKALAGDPETKGQPISVATVRTGVVQLGGSVASYPVEQQAVQLARHTLGVMLVENNIVVRGEQQASSPQGAGE